MFPNAGRDVDDLGPARRPRRHGAATDSARRAKLGGGAAVRREPRSNGRAAPASLCAWSDWEARRRSSCRTRRIVIEPRRDFLPAAGPAQLGLAPLRVRSRQCAADARPGRCETAMAGRAMPRWRLAILLDLDLRSTPTPV